MKMMPRQFRHITQHYHKSRLEWNVSIKICSILSRLKNVFAVVKQSKYFMFKIYSMSDFSKKNKQCRQGFEIPIIVGIHFIGNFYWINHNQ